MFQVFVGSPPVTSLVLGNNGDRAPWHNTGYEQDWKGTQVGFGAPLGASALAPFQSPHVVSAPLAWCGAEPSWEAPAPSWPGSRVPFPVQKQSGGASWDRSPSALFLCCRSITAHRFSQPFLGKSCMSGWSPWLQNPSVGLQGDSSKDQERVLILH